MKFRERVKHDRRQSSLPKAIKRKPVYEYNRIGIPVKEGVNMILCRDILRCEANKSHCIFYLVSGETMHVKRHLGYYEEKLMEWDFVKVHKSHLVNMQHVENYINEKESCVVLTDQTRIPVSVRRRNMLLKRIKFSAAYLALQDKMAK